ncbi:MAG: pseudouridine synthase [Planctomycetota bacterium]
MARRHVDRKPGERLSRGAGGKSRGGPKPGGKPGSQRSGGTRNASNRSSGSSDRRGPGADRKPSSQGRNVTGGSRRREEGLIVKPSTVLGDAESVKDGKIRLNHFLARAGVCSRRLADEHIASGRVQVNGEIIRELGVRVDPIEDDVLFDGMRLEPEKSVYVLLNKPKGVVCTNADNEQKKRVVDLLPTIRGRIFTVGRLDMDSEGLLLITNDGAFAQEMTHPRYGVAKLYSVVVRGRVEDGVLDKARGGVWLSEGPTGGMQLKIDRMTKERSYLKVTLREGKNREIRRVFAKLGFPVVSLKRVRIGQLNLHGLRDGDWRFLRLDEVAKLRDLARSELEQAPPERPRSRPASRSVVKRVAKTVERVPARASAGRSTGGPAGRPSSRSSAPSGRGASGSSRSGSSRSGAGKSGLGKSGTGKSGTGRSGTGRSGPKSSRGGARRSTKR